MYDWQERTAMLVGEEMLEHFRNSTVAVIGVGGVGGYAAEMIVRAGVGHLIILDSDDVSVTNKNRQLLALDSTVGRPKCDVLAERLMDINPELDLTVIKEYLEAENYYTKALRERGYNTSKGKFYPAFDIRMIFGTYGAPTEYRRELDMVNGVCTVTYKDNGEKWTRRVFASKTDNLLLVNN